MEARDLAFMAPLLMTTACAPDPYQCETDLRASSAMENVKLYVSGVMDEEEDELTTYTVTAVPDGDLGSNPDAILIPNIGEPWSAGVKSDSPEGGPSELIITAEIDHSKVDIAELWLTPNNDCSTHVVWMTSDLEGEYIETPFLHLPQ